MADIYQLPPHHNMTPQECLDHAALTAAEQAEVIVICVDVDGRLGVTSSAMSRNDAVWLLLLALDHARAAHA